ncbi:hypothetical protein P3X46_035065 [Hevea brasiliensis]|uniref:Rieske domain-containing protein n=1 Tax=Hevea brasiliensis TaxID=3981 RepID=A0ABQ9K8D7_HEVBR|nr:hypothetical protein P3X46_035065 [Hevea brasiliensis]
MPLQPKNHTSFLAQNRPFKVSCCVLHNPSSLHIHCQKLVNEFEPRIPIEKTLTPPRSWYTDPSFYDYELHRIFYGGWQAVGYTEQIKDPRGFFTARYIYIDDDGKVHAFHNACSHHGSLLASGSGKKSCFVCPYHGILFAWTYGLDGEFGLVPLNVATWGPFVLLNMGKENSPYQEVDGNMVENEWLVDFSLSYVCRCVYNIECNWKVRCFNMNGGCHVPYAHKDLASGLKLDSYSTIIYEKFSIQRCEGGSARSEDDFVRLGSKALCDFIYPNFMINRYGPWMDTNLVLLLGARKCQVIFDYFIEAYHKDDKAFIERSSVQSGLESPEYCSGRCAPTVEKAMHHFHQLLHDNLKM